MSITNNTIVAKTAAVVAGLGLVAMSFASFAPAQAQSTSDLQAQINSLLATIASLQSQLGGSASASASVTFTRDLTIGATGSDVTALQTWLISKGYSIPAGATGYFGAQTQAALAAYQAANGITPAAGYFGPITRAKVNASAGTSTGTGTGTGTSTGSTSLKGGEADLSNYDLRTGDDLAEGDTNTEIATAKFDVDGGDVNVQRVRLTLQAKDTSNNVSTSPWKFFDTLYVYDGSTKVGSVDAGSRDDWDSQDGDNGVSSADAYQISIPVNTVVKDGDTAELSIRADAQNTIDSSDTDQVFDMYIDSQDIRAVDAAGIQEYTGSDNDSVSVGFNSSNDGKLTVSEDSSDPDAGVLVADDNETTSDLTVFAFKLKNTEDGDALIDSVHVRVATTSASGSDAANITSIIRKATLTLDGHDYDGDINTNNTIDFDLSNDDVTVDGNDSEVGTLKIDLASADSHYASTGESLTFSIVGSSDIDAEGVDSGDNTTVTGTANGNKQSIALNGGISVEGNDMSTNLTYNSNSPASSYGTFTLKFDVTAVGDDVYVPKTLEAGASTTSWGANTGVTVITDLVGSTTSSTVSASLTTTADSDNSNYYVIHAGDTETFTATVTIDPTATGDYQVGVNSIRFNTDDSTFTGLQTLDVDQTDSQFHTDPLHIPNS